MELYGHQIIDYFIYISWGLEPLMCIRFHYTDLRVIATETYNVHLYIIDYFLYNLRYEKCFSLDTVFYV